MATSRCRTSATETSGAGGGGGAFFSWHPAKTSAAAVTDTIDTNLLIVAGITVPSATRPWVTKQPREAGDAEPRSPHSPGGMAGTLDLVPTREAPGRRFAP